MLENELKESPLKQLSTESLLGEIQRRITTVFEIDPNQLASIQAIYDTASQKPQTTEVQLAPEAQTKKWVDLIRKQGYGHLIGKFNPEWTFDGDSIEGQETGILQLLHLVVI